jgi:hypothetical protein
MQLRLAHSRSLKVRRYESNRLNHGGDRIKPDDAEKIGRQEALKLPLPLLRRRVAVHARSKRHVLKYAGEPRRIGLDVHSRRANARVARYLCESLQVDAAPDL